MNLNSITPKPLNRMAHLEIGSWDVGGTDSCRRIHSDGPAVGQCSVTLLRVSKPKGLKPSRSLER